MRFLCVSLAATILPRLRLVLRLCFSFRCCLPARRTITLPPAVILYRLAADCGGRYREAGEWARGQRPECGGCVQRQARHAPAELLRLHLLLGLRECCSNGAPCQA